MGLSLRISAIMSARSASSTPHTRRNAAKSRRATRSRCASSACIAGIEAVLLPELDREAFAQVSRAHAGRIEGLQDGEHRLDFGLRRAEPLRDRIEIAGEVTGLVDQIDEMAADHAPHRIRDRERKLFAEVIRECRLGGYEGLEIVVAVLAAARADAGPFRIGGRLLLRRPRRRLGGVREDVLDAGVEGVLDRRGAVHLGGFTGRFGGGFLALVAFRGAFAGALQQRIALQFAFHIGGEVEIRELQQLDGLHQLRRHHQSLALAEFESLGQRHVAVQYWSGSCFSLFGRGCTPGYPDFLTGVLTTLSLAHDATC